MKARQLEKLGIPAPLAKMAKWLTADARKAGMGQLEVRRLLRDLAQNPDDYRNHGRFGELATKMSQYRCAAAATAPQDEPRSEPVPWRQWGRDLDAQSIEQMHNACQLPVSVAGALMPDAHVGYGLPIGGVLATDGAVIPYAVGVDIACRMKMTVLDLPPEALQSQTDRLIHAIERETRFGIGSHFKGKRREHAVLDEDWNVSPITRQMKDKAHAQLGTSGSGNHFVEFGILTLEQDDLGLQAGTYLALLSHSGSRGTGANVCSHYSRLAMHLHPNLPRHLRYLAWLDMTTHDGQEYWAAMQLMGKYAAANHAMIHHHIARHLGAQVLADIENHHNFAWQETHRIGGETKDVIVHRKGATPAGQGVLGIIPGSMATPCYVVRGKGSAASMHSAAHGAGRVMSRKKAKQTYRWPQVEKLLKDRGVILLSAGLDEVPFVYKDIDTVMSQQRDLTEPIARFDPKLVKMAPAGDRPED